MQNAVRGFVLVAVCSLIPVVSGCTDQGCLSGKAGCRVVAPCQSVSFACEGGTVAVKTLKATDAAPGGMDALGGAGDVLLENDHLQVVIAQIGNQNGVDPNGGTLLDVAVRGKDNDGLNSIAQTTGLLPRDGVRFTSLEVIDESPARVAVQVSGTLDGYPDTNVYTLYELRPCDRGVRMRTEIVNGFNQPQTWALSDVFYWQDREAISFSAGPGLGFTHPPLTLSGANAAYRGFPFLAGANHEAPYNSYAHVACNVERMEGLNNDFISLSGLPRAHINPREYQVFERLLIAEDGKDIASAVDTALEVRTQLWDEQFVTISGKVERAGALRLDTPRETMIVISEGTLATDVAERTPWTQVVPDAAGAWSAKVPKGRAFIAQVYSFGRIRVERDLGEVDADSDAGTFTLPSTSRVTLTVTDEAGMMPVTALVYAIPVDEQARAEVAGTFAGHEWVGAVAQCAPWLGPEYGGSPACNRVIVENGQVTVEVPMGRYFFYAFKGPFWTIDREQVELKDGDATIALSIRSLPLQPAQTLNADLHVHSGASFDSSLPQKDRVLGFEASDLQIIVASEHDVGWSFQNTIQELGLSSKMSSLDGVETTAQIPFMSVPGDGFPRVIGHYIFWPIRFDPAQPRNGAPYDDLIEPGVLFDRVDPLYTSSVPMIQLPHPWGGPYFGRDTGFPRAIHMDARGDIPETDDGTRMGMLQRAPGGKNVNNGHHAQEVMNGTDNSSLLQYRSVWWYMLGQGQLKTGTANSDSHSLTDNIVGVPRNVVHTSTPAGTGFNANEFNQALRDGRSFGTNGPIIEAQVKGPTGMAIDYGLKPFTPPADAQVRVKISAAPWVPVQEVRFIVNGKLVKIVSGAALNAPVDPFGADGLVRFDGDVPLSELIGGISGDAWLVIEAGDPLPPSADLGGGLDSGSGCANQVLDGVPDTGDNNGDGQVDCADVAEDDDFGPLPMPKAPADEADVNYHFARVVPDGRPFAYINPFILDLNGNGRFDAPKTGGAK